MAEDLYTEWLSVAPGKRPPNHYELLGVPLFSNDIDAIETSTRARMDRLDQYSLHRDREKRDAVQQMMNEVAQARVCLVNAGRKRDYDAELAKALHVAAPAPLAADEPALAPIDIKDLAALAAPAPANPLTAFEQRLRRHLLKWELNPSEERLLLAEASNLGVGPDVALKLIHDVDAECEDVAQTKSRRWTVAIAIFAVLAILGGAAVIFVPRYQHSRKEELVNLRLAAAGKWLDQDKYDELAAQLSAAEEILPNQPAVEEFRVKAADRLLAQIDAALRGEKADQARWLLDAARSICPSDGRFAKFDEPVAALAKALRDRQEAQATAQRRAKVQVLLTELMDKIAARDFDAAGKLVDPLYKARSKSPESGASIHAAMVKAMKGILDASDAPAAQRLAGVWARLEPQDRQAGEMMRDHFAATLMESAQRNWDAKDTASARRDAQRVLAIQPENEAAKALLARLDAFASASQPTIIQTVVATPTQPATNPAITAVPPATKPAPASGEAPKSLPANPAEPAGPHLAAVVAAMVDAASGTVITASPTQVRLWDLKTGRQKASFDVEVSSLCISPAGGKAVATSLEPGAGAYRGIYFLDLVNGEAKLLADENGGVRTLAAVFSPGGKFVYARESTMRTAPAVWETATGKRRILAAPPAAEIFHQTAFTPTDDFFVAASSRTICVWSLETGAIVPLNAPNDLMIPSASTVGRIGGTWVLAPAGAGGAGAVPGALRIQDNALSPVRIRETSSLARYISLDGQWLLMGSRSRGYAWNLRTGESKTSPALADGERVFLEGLQIAANGSRALLISSKGLAVWNVKENTLTPLEQPAKRTVYYSPYRVKLSPTGAAVVYESSGMQIWNAVTGKLVPAEIPPGAGVFSSFSEDASAFLLDGKVYLGLTRNGLAAWNLETGRMTAVRLKAGRSVRPPIAVCPDGKTVAFCTTDADSSLVLWDVTTGVANAVRLGDPAILNLRFSTKGDLLVVAASTGIAAIEATNGKVLARLPARITTLRFEDRLSADCSFLLDPAPAGIGVYDTRTGKVICQLGANLPATQPATP